MSIHGALTASVNEYTPQRLTRSPSLIQLLSSFA
jgi:hypothetical protein